MRRARNGGEGRAAEDICTEHAGVSGFGQRWGFQGRTCYGT